MIESLKYLMGSWRPEIGDPTFMGWFTVVSYFLCAAVAFRAGSTLSGRDRQGHRLWVLIAFFMILLGVNKQLDLQSLFTEIGRRVARKQGWMEERRIVQFWFIVGFGTAALIGFILFAVAMRSVFRRFLLAFCGLFFLVTFIVVRAASFHHFDQWIQSRVFEIKMNWVMELGGIYTIAAAGLKEAIAGTKRGHPRDRF